ncbi:hypothetical protein WJX81_001915 [Elliptochloris bilobata]|uniref:G-patch domain-containing protein n=1 Tax=Elliptochloris bilobata TaxID=381761 RepID=A0AAW1SLB2_9CHLO
MKLPPGYVPGQGVRRASAYGGVGERLLKGMGWQDGQGLGRSQKGIKSALEVKRKDDTAGVGLRAGYDWENRWWEAAYDRSVQAVDQAASSSDSDAPSPHSPARQAYHRDGMRTTRFVSTGYLEGLGFEPAARKRQTFDEGDQEGLYMAAHATKTANKKGLGTRAALKVAAGERWAGSRKVFADAEDAAEAALPDAAEPAPPVAAEAGAAGGDDAASSAAAALSGVKWKKLAARALAEAPVHTLTMKALRRRVAAALLAKGAPAASASRKRQGAALLAAVNKSARFCVEGGAVRLARGASGKL